MSETSLHRFRLPETIKFQSPKYAVILSKMIFFLFKNKVHIFNIPVTFMGSFRLAA